MASHLLSCLDNKTGEKTSPSHTIPNQRTNQGHFTHPRLSLSLHVSLRITLPTKMMRSASDQLAFHERYQDRLRPIFLSHADQVLSSPRSPHPHARDRRPNEGADQMDPQWRVLAAEMSDLGVTPTPSASPARTCAPHQSRQSSNDHRREGNDAGCEEQPHRRQSHGGEQKGRPPPPAAAAADVIARLEQVQTGSRAPSRREIEALLRDVEAHLLWADDHANPRASSHSKVLHDAWDHRGHSGSAQANRSPTRRAPEPPLVASSATSCSSSSSSSLHVTSSRPFTDVCHPHHGPARTSPRTQGEESDPTTSSPDALARWCRQYAGWRDEYLTWYNTHYDAYCRYYGQPPPPPAALPWSGVAIGTDDAPRRKAAAPVTQRGTRESGPSQKPLRKMPKEEALSNSSRGAGGARTTTRKEVSRMAIEYEEDDDTEVHGPVLYQAERTPRRPAPVPCRSKSSSRGASTATATSITTSSTATASASYFPHTLRASVYERKRQDALKQQPAWRN